MFMLHAANKKTSTRRRNNRHEVRLALPCIHADDDMHPIRSLSTGGAVPAVRCASPLPQCSSKGDRVTLDGRTVPIKLPCGYGVQLPLYKQDCMCRAVGATPSYQHPSYRAHLNAGIWAQVQDHLEVDPKDTVPPLQAAAIMPITLRVVFI